MPSEPVIEDDVANCAVNYLFESNGIHYYDTVSCISAIAGWGISDQEILNPQGCDALGECQSPVTPLITSNAVGVAASASMATTGSSLSTSSYAEDLTNQQKQFLHQTADKFKSNILPEFPADQSRQRRILRAVDEFSRRYTTTPPDVNQRRKDLNLWIATNYNQLKIGSTIHRTYWSEVMKALHRVSVKNASLDKWLTTPDRPFPLVRPIGISTPVDIKDTSILVPDAEITGAGDPFVKVKVRRPRVGDRLVYFRLQHVKVKTSGDFLFHVGQEIEQEVLKDAGISLGSIKEFELLDRHCHFHLLKGADSNGDTYEYHVYSANRQAFGEYFV